MKTTQIRRTIILASALGLIISSFQTFAQTSSNDLEVRIQQLNRQAMDAYAKMNITSATQDLEQALSLCREHNLSGDVLVRTYINLGAIEAGGRQNNTAATEYFKKANCLDRNAKLDPMFSSPEIEGLFSIAKAQANTQGECSAEDNLPPAPPPPPPDAQAGTIAKEPIPVPVQASSLKLVTSGIMRHQPVPQQTRLTPVPIYAEVNPELPAERVVLFYRTVGEKIFQKVNMRSHGQGFAAIIGCDVLQTFDPAGIEYYMSAFDANEQLLGTAGTEAQPFHVAFVPALSGPAPSLPDSPPTTMCLGECPPWNPGCNSSDCKQFGDLCDDDYECCSGNCTGETCVAAGKRKKDGGPFSPMLRVALSFGTGAGLITSENVYPYNQVSFNPRPDAIKENSAIPLETGLYWSKLHFRINPIYYITDKFFVGVTFRGGLALTADSEVMPVAPLGLANVGYRVVGEGSDTFELDAMLGIGGGVIQHKVLYDDCALYTVEKEDDHPWWVEGRTTYQGIDANGEIFYYQDGCHEDSLDPDTFDWVGADADHMEVDNDKAYFRKAGYFAAELGLDMYFWIIDNVGINVGVMVGVLLPHFAVQADAQAGVALRF